MELKDKLFAKEELAEGHAVQSALMPSRTPTIPGWSVWLYTAPANDVGGDLVDHIALGQGKHGVAIGDVSGKGLSAALYMAKLQSTLRAFVSDTFELGALAKKVNEIFCRDAQSNRFASLIYLELHEHEGDVAWFNAGHLAPMLVRGNRLESLGKGDAALGLRSDMKYEKHTAHLNQGDWLVLYSDGVTESVDESGAFLGDARFREWLRIEGHKDAPSRGIHITERLARYIGNAALSDDISLVILQRI